MLKLPLHSLYQLHSCLFLNLSPFLECLLHEVSEEWVWIGFPDSSCLPMRTAPAVRKWKLAIIQSTPLLYCYPNCNLHDLTNLFKQQHTSSSLCQLVSSRASIYPSSDNNMIKHVTDQTVYCYQMVVMSILVILVLRNYLLWSV